jgi:hypothetical protein
MRMCHRRHPHQRVARHQQRLVQHDEPDGKKESLAR